MHRPVPHAVVLLAVLVASVPVPATAQVVERATFALAPAEVMSLDLIATPSGTLLVFNDMRDLSHVFARRFDPQGFLLGEITIDTAKFPDEPTAALDPRGGFIAAWRGAVYSSPTSFRPGLFTRRLDAFGRPIGRTSRATDDGIFANAPSVAALPSGALYVWYDLEGMYARRFTASGLALSDAFLVDASGGESVILPTSDGGYLLVYRRYVVQDLNGQVRMRAHGASGELRDEAMVSDDFDFTDAALAPNEDVAVAVGIDQPDPEAPATNVIFRRFHLDGSPAGADVTVASAPLGVSGPQVAFDVFGNVLVTWGENGGVWARAFDAADAPLGAAVQVGTEPVADAITPLPGLRTVRLVTGTFASAWTDGTRAWGNVVTLCPAGSATCGDGVYAPTCEGCDDGAANSDTLPDACRTNCRRAGCGDGVLDSAEACDDGNQTSCDGCSATCTVEPGALCGDAVVSAGCEGCDDGNAVAGDGCAPTCALERVLGGGPSTTECYTEWRVDNAANVPLLAKKGGINPQQRCVDDDPRCDFDGGVPGSCTFRVAVCANNTNVASCEPGQRLLGWDLKKPSTKLAAIRPALAAVRAAFDLVPSAIVGSGTRDVCSDYALVPVPLRGGPGAWASGKLSLVTNAELYSGRDDVDKIKLTCLPATP